MNGLDGVPQPDPTIGDTASRLATLLTAGGDRLRDPTRSDLVFEPVLDVRPLVQAAAPADVWAVDGGQSLVADARCLQVYVTRAARVRWQDDRSVMEDEGTLRAWLLGLGEERAALTRSGAPVAADATVDVNLLREWDEWSTVAACVAGCDPGGVVLVDGDLQPDWRIGSGWLGALLESASARGVTLVGVTKHSSLSRGGAPLLGQLEQHAASSLGPRACWWVPVARTRPDVGPGLQVVVARLDPDARFAFRVDLPGDLGSASDSVPAVLGALSALSDDAAFPGYPYPLSIADRLAACPGWVRDEVWDQIQRRLDEAGVGLEVQERAFTDRHRLMERS
ncbi:MAG TPA: DNA double-strand break repair nuclease NurA [Acidimicrobiales bacterium]|jgi:hypothetical protein